MGKISVAVKSGDEGTQLIRMQTEVGHCENTAVLLAFQQCSLELSQHRTLVISRVTCFSAVV
jgi:hypothetical protein